MSNNFDIEKGSLEYYKELLFNIDIELKFDTKRMFEEKYIQALKEKDYFMLKSVFYHEEKLKALPLFNGGYDHCWMLPNLLDILACDEFDNIYRIFPKGLPLSTNGYSMYVKATNLILCILYPEDYDVNKVIKQAEKYIVTKQPIWNRAVVACILSILNHDISEFSKNIQMVCEGYTRVDLIEYKKMQCKSAYGLIVLAKHFLTEEEFLKVKYPEHKTFDSNYIKWFMNLDKLPKDLCFKYEGDFYEMNDILKMPIAITRIHQPYLETDNSYISLKEKKAWYITKDKMLEDFCLNIIKILK